MINKQLDSIRNPIQKGAPNQYGVEKFRGKQWKDAWELFLNEPIFGIGFQKQVVYRVHYYNDVYVQNNSFWFHDGRPPLSGPHNSYLNALARLGILGIGFLVLHISVGIRLWKHRYYAALSMLFAQSLYAMFNIGLENPAGNFFLLLAVAAALRIKQET